MTDRNAHEKSEAAYAFEYSKHHPSILAGGHADYTNAHRKALTAANIAFLQALHASSEAMELMATVGENYFDRNGKYDWHDIMDAALSALLLLAKGE